MNGYEGKRKKEKTESKARDAIFIVNGYVIGDKKRELIFIKREKDDKAGDG